MRTQAQQLLGVKKRTEDNFKKNTLIKFLASISYGFIDERVAFRSGFYAINKGMPDVFFYHPTGIYAFETKRKRGVVSVVQKECHEKLKKAGVRVFVVNPENFESLKPLLIEKFSQKLSSDN